MRAFLILLVAAALASKLDVVCHQAPFMRMPLSFWRSAQAPEVLDLREEVGEGVGGFFSALQTSGTLRNS